MASIRLTKVIEKMKLENLTPELDIANVKITQPDINRPALQLAGYLEHFATTRLQVMGFVEYSYMMSMSEEKKKEIYEGIIQDDCPGFVFCRELVPDEAFLAVANRKGVPVLNTKKATSAFMAEIIRWLNVKLAPCISVHGVLVDVYGEGVLITGESGIGKSEAALELIKWARRTGGRLTPPGRLGKTVKKWMIEEKIPRFQREVLPVFDWDGRPAAVAGLGPDRAFAAREGQRAWHIVVTISE